jgi:hypothetical protein
MSRSWWRGVPLAVLLLSGGAEAADSFFKEPIKLDLSAPFAGPDGSPATPASALLLSADEIATIQGGKHNAALLWHGGGDWVTAVNRSAFPASQSSTPRASRRNRRRRSSPPQ